MTNLIGYTIACLPAAIIIYVVAKGLIRHMVEENTPGQSAWEVRNPEHYGVPPDIYAVRKGKH